MLALQFSLKTQCSRIGRIGATMTLMFIVKGFCLGVVLFLMIHCWGGVGVPLTERVVMESYPQRTYF